VVFQDTRLVGYLVVDFDESMERIFTQNIQPMTTFVLLRARSTELLSIEAFEIQESTRTPASLRIQVSDTEMECVNASQQASFGNAGLSLNGPIQRIQICRAQIESKIKQLVAQLDSAPSPQSKSQCAREAFLIMSILRTLKSFSEDASDLNLEALTTGSVLARTCMRANQISSFLERKPSSVK